MRNPFKSLVLAFITMFAGIAASAQVTTSSLGGRVVDQNGEPVIGAAVVAIHEPSGTSYGSVTNMDGLYTIQGMRTGGPYRVEVSCLGYQQVNYTGVTLTLAETYNLNAQLPESSEFLSEAVVIAAPTSKFAAVEKTGASTNISQAEMLEMPTISRSITDLAKISPYGGNGMSFSGADGRNVNFTVDGANFNNNFGLSDGLPGGGAPISIDAIEEMQVVISPFDVRQTNFIGGGVNAVTKSGTNKFRGTAYVYHQNENMHGNRVYEEELAAREIDRKTTYGFTLGGPIVKNKLFFFVNFEYVDTPSTAFRWRASENGVMNIDQYISRVTLNDLQLVQDKLKRDYGYDTGSYTDFPALKSNMKVLGRIDWNISQKHKLALRYNYTNNKNWLGPNASSSNASMTPAFARVSQFGMTFANNMYSMNNRVQTWSVDLNSRFSNSFSNQLLATYSMIADVRGSNSEKFPHIDILGNYYKANGAMDMMLPYISAGYELFTWTNAVNNNTLTIKDDLTWYAGAHKVTAGASFEYQMADNHYMRNGTGYYRYSSLQDFLNEGTPETVAITYGYDGEKEPAARVRFYQAGLYLQDDWSASDRFKLNYGFRVDRLMFNNADVATNVQILNLDYGGKHLDTGTWPKSRFIFSPRVGFTWDVFGNKSLKVRGGTGLFAGRIPLVFFTNMPTNSGMVQNVVALSTTYSGGIANPNPLLSEFSGKMITDTDELIKKLNSLNPDKYPLDRPDKEGVTPSTVNGVDPTFRMPQVWKSSLALDYNFPTSFPLSVTGEFTFTKTLNAVTMKNWNIRDNEGWTTFSGPDNRHIYPGTRTGGVLDYKYNGSDAYVLSNTDKGYGWIAMFSINAEPVRGLRMNASYTHTVNKELTGLPGSNAASTMNYVPSVEGANFLSLHTSQYVNPDRIMASVSYMDKGNNHYSLFYEGLRYGGYSWIYGNDINGDSNNYDALYIPKDKNELRFVSDKDRDDFWAFVNQDAYLSKHLGQYAEAYDMAAPMRHVFDFRYMHDFKVNIGTTTNVLQLSVDVQNVGNLFNSKWGVSSRLWTNNSYANPLRLDHIDIDGVPVYSSSVSGATSTWTPSKSYGNCWYMQIGIKYLFN